MAPRPDMTRGRGTQNNQGFGRSSDQSHHNGGLRQSQGSDISSELEMIKTKKDLSELSVEEISKADGIAEKLAKSFKGSLKTTQLRKFFDNIASNQERLKTGEWKEIESDFYMIRPNLAYAKGRRLIPEDFFVLVSLCLERVHTQGASEERIKENYDRFVALMQALVAYSKYYER
ncbi:MAG: type III-A CRISPR-associated protein Csm2 [Methanospirillum sp.]|uniref:type III-A CRISPR-associated protein Csm2 n=1 Tax=Methanospirillum sp. TaxID=45200 RepID=UPI002369AE81|nr:type III-A CRISPR-associated protein Csm2 [Methanospirillum sp.]MDD1730334.1 type III-A CRISPR-associated protein Csm2 [Methanospirillum sp.]